MRRQRAAIRIGPARIGRGLFAATTFRPRQVIVHITGRIRSADYLWDHQGVLADNCFRFGPETYLDPGDGAGRYLNHSCEPNAAVHKANNRLFLVALAPIIATDEIVIDYSTILGDDDIWTMKCKCGSPICRRAVRSFGSLSAEQQRRYIEAAAVPRYILATL